MANKIQHQHRGNENYDMNITKLDKFIDTTGKVKAVDEKGNIAYGRTFKNVGRKIEIKFVRLSGLIRGKGWINNAKVEKQISNQVKHLIDNIHEFKSFSKEVRDNLHKFVYDLRGVAVKLDDKNVDENLVKLVKADLDLLYGAIIDMKVSSEASRGVNLGTDKEENVIRKGNEGKVAFAEKHKGNIKTLNENLKKNEGTRTETGARKGRFEAAKAQIGGESSKILKGHVEGRDRREGIEVTKKGLAEQLNAPGRQVATQRLRNETLNSLWEDDQKFIDKINLMNRKFPFLKLERSPHFNRLREGTSEKTREAITSHKKLFGKIVEYAEQQRMRMPGINEKFTELDKFVKELKKDLEEVS